MQLETTFQIPYLPQLWIRYEFPQHKDQAPGLYPHSTEVLAGAGHAVVSQNWERWFQEHPGETELSRGSKADVTTKQHEPPRV